MGSIAAVVAALLLHSSRPELPVDPPRPPKPQPKPRELPIEPIEYVCILDEPLPPPLLVQSCETRKPEIEGVIFLRDCPEWIDKMVAEAEGL